MLTVRCHLEPPFCHSVFTGFAAGAARQMGIQNPVVSIGRLTAFYVVFVPLEYILNEPPH